jgi:hypothetical protein
MKRQNPIKTEEQERKERSTAFFHAFMKDLDPLLDGKYEKIYKKYIINKDMNIIIDELKKLCKSEERNEHTYYFKDGWCAKFKNQSLIHVYHAKTIEEFEEIAYEFRDYYPCF